ncbi:potassium-transporting ATPase subunit KdpC [Nocardioides sp. zg-536]|uniref:Potassium-transporting ATPase KdpC subunit n=1 Tax=Nocardioides faecalis TaxID=2803858 RepID=A0A938Y8R7_9ACTN|nr:potassium-transporting ATPase subunit KdpC [Nocardioides faecalis]MBM9460253.1 potassium-transporting ATPase subunit KdpC [Nocardioides faecalis]QVI59961.1 potassium-transporting ATPase subunit KdpC [Nocardioides faecalis]
MNDLYTLFRQSLAGLRLLAVLTLLLGVAYPLTLTGIAQVALPWQANGSLVTASGAHTTDADEAVGSVLIGQPSDDEALFLNRPSAAGDGYDMLASYGSNLGPSNTDLVAAILERRTAIAELEDVAAGTVPPDAVTASGSGLDPDISPTYAALQVPRVARANDLAEVEVERLVAEHTSGRTWGVLGEPRVNVLELNIAVRRLAGS